MSSASKPGTPGVTGQDPFRGFAVDEVPVSRVVDRYVGLDAAIGRAARRNSARSQQRSNTEQSLSEISRMGGRVQRREDMFCNIPGDVVDMMLDPWGDHRLENAFGIAAVMRGGGW